MLVQLICVSALLTTVLSKIELGTCKALGVADQWPFDMTLFSGKWYLKYSSDGSSQRCINWNFNLDNYSNQPVSQFVIHYAGIDLKTNRVETKDGVAIWTEQPSGLSVTFNDDEWGSTGQVYHILSTDYSSYALLYTCRTRFWYYRSRSLVYLTRDQHLTGMSADALSALEAYNLKSWQLKEVSHDFCQY